MSIFNSTKTAFCRSTSSVPRLYTYTTVAAMSSISDAIKKDHAEIQTYAKNIRESIDNDTKTRWQNQFTWELARHSIGEELVVYPAFSKHLGMKGQEMADEDRAEHQSVYPHRLRRRESNS